MIRRTFALIGLVATLAAAAAAQDGKKDGPKPKKAVVPDSYRAYLVTDARFLPRVNTPLDRKTWTVDASVKLKGDDRDARDRTSKMHCLVCENGPAPVVAIFTRQDPKGADPNAGAVKLAQDLDKLIPKYRGDKLAGFLMFLRLEGEYPAEPNDDTRDLLAQQVRDVAVAANTTFVPFGLAPKQSETNAQWGIGDADQVVVVLYYRMRVEKRWTFDAAGPTPEQIKEVLDAAQKAITEQ
jgi:hypothetical protein